MSKRCSRCGEEKALTEFHKRAVARDGLNAACKTCICAERAAFRAANNDRIKAYQAARRANPATRDADYEATRRWRKANPGQVAEYARRYAEENAPAISERKKAWYAANRETVLARHRANPDGRRESAARYRERHREVRAERERRRHAIKRGNPVSQVDLESLWTGTCPLCGGELDRDLKKPDLMRKSLDHIISLARGGAHATSNLQWTHLRCNIAKGARMPTEKLVS